MQHLTATERAINEMWNYIILNKTRLDVINVEEEARVQAEKLRNKAAYI